jgi:anti-sigma-K factor RskA
VTHEETWTRLPDLLDDRDDAALLAHVQVCADCQRQLFLLGRVDRLLRDRTQTLGSAGGRLPRLRWRGVVAAAAAAVVAALAASLALVGSQPAAPHALTFRTGSGGAVGQAVMGHSDARNVSLALSARHLPVGRGQLFVLWAGGDARASMQVGRFMVDHSGGCRVRFNLPADHTWARFWITRPGAPSAIVAST